MVWNLSRTPVTVWVGDAQLDNKVVASLRLGHLRRCCCWIQQPDDSHRVDLKCRQKHTCLNSSEGGDGDGPRGIGSIWAQAQTVPV
jgi:hypothetical protein